VLAAIFGAVVSSLASMLNSSSTIFAMDIYRKIKKNPSQFELVSVGRICVVAFVFIAMLIAPRLDNPKFGGIFTFIQEFQGFISPGILSIFLFGVLVHRAPRACGTVGLIINPVLYGALKSHGNLLLCDPRCADAHDPAETAARTGHPSCERRHGHADRSADQGLRHRGDSPDPDLVRNLLVDESGTNDVTHAHYNHGAIDELGRLAAESGLDVAGGTIRRSSSRFCLGVEHGDYNGTELFGVGTDRFIWLAYKPNDTGLVRLFSGNFPGDGVISFEPGTVPSPQSSEIADTWGRFPYGVDHVLRRGGSRPPA